MPYLDYAATTPLIGEVLEAMLPYLREHFGNPSSVYLRGREARKGLEDAREQVAAAVGAGAGEIVFTGGGTEGDNLALKGAVLRDRGRGEHVVTVATEHHAVLHSARWLERQGFSVTYLGVDGEGMLDLDELRESLTPKTLAVSIMYVNNEVGTIQHISQAASIVKEHSRAIFHTDAVQALGKIEVDVEALGVDLASFSAHKIGGPKGVGALYVRRGTPLEAHIDGGGQERDLRSGTPNVAGIVGLGRAAEIAAGEVEAEGERLGKLRDRLEQGILASIDGIRVNGENASRIPGTLNVCIDGVEGESLLLMLDGEDIAASSGSACTSGSLDASHVLLAMGVPEKVALGSLRVSLGRGSEDADVDALLAALPPIVDRLRAVSG